MSLDPTSNIGKVRLRVADYSDLVLLPDSVYQATLDDTGDNLTQTASIIARYILGMLSHKTHRKLAQLEVWGAENFQNYKEFLLLTVSNPAFMDVSPIPHSSAAEFSPILQFQSDWNKNFTQGTESQALATNASISPNDGSLYGPTGGRTDGWQLT